MNGAADSRGVKVCPACKAELPGDAAFCPHDGADLSAGLGTAARTAIWYKAPQRGDVLLGRYRALRSRAGARAAEARAAGRGAGEFVEARDIVDGCQVLLQVYPTPLGADAAERRRDMRRRAERLLGLSGAGVIPVVRCAEDGDKNLVVISSAATGFSLAEILDHTGPVAPGRVARIGAELAQILHGVHTGDGILHLDLRPEVVFLVREADSERAVLGGWRISGGPNELAVPIPEEVAGDTPDERGDVYLLGALMYRLVIGTFGPAAPRAAAPPGVEIPFDLESVITRCMDRDVRGRPRSAEEVAQLLQNCRCFGSWTNASVRESWAALPIHDLALGDGASMTHLRPPTRARTYLWAAACAVALAAGAALHMSSGGPDPGAPRPLIAPRMDPSATAGPPDAAAPDLPVEDPVGPPAPPMPSSPRSAPRPPGDAPAPAPGPTADAAGRPAGLPPARRLYWEGGAPPLQAVERLSGGDEPPFGHPAHAHLERGRALYRAGQHGKALEELDRAYAIAPLPVILKEMAQTYAALNDDDKAVTYFQSYLKKGALSKLEAETVRRLIRHIEARKEGGGGDDGGGHVSPVFGDAAHDPKALYRAGALSYDAGDYATALARFKDAYASSPAPALEYNVALALEQLGRRAEAAEWLQRFRRRPGLAEDRRAEVDERIARLQGTGAGAPTPPAGDD